MAYTAHTEVPKLLLSLKEAAAATSVSRDTLRREIERGRLRAKRAGDGTGRILVTSAQLMAWYEQLPDA